VVEDIRQVSYLYPRTGNDRILLHFCIKFPLRFLDRRQHQQTESILPPSQALPKEVHLQAHAPLPFGFGESATLRDSSALAIEGIDIWAVRQRSSFINKQAVLVGRVDLPLRRSCYGILTPISTTAFKAGHVKSIR
jgi:hypothetical protein